MAIFGNQRHHGVGGAFGAGSGNGYHAANRQGFRDRPLFAAVEIPKVTVILDTQSDAFSRVHNRTAADGQNEVHTLFFCQFDTLVNQISVRTCLDSAQFHIGDAFRIQSCLHTIQQAGALYTAAAVMDQDLMTAIFFDQFTGFGFRTLAKYEISGAVKRKVLHNNLQCVF